MDIDSGLMIDSFESLIAIWIKQSTINLYREYQCTFTMHHFLYPKWTCFDLVNRSDETNEAAVYVHMYVVEHVESYIIPSGRN